MSGGLVCWGPTSWVGLSLALLWRLIYETVLLRITETQPLGYKIVPVSPHLAKMAQKTAAQEEFDDLLAKNSQGRKETSHPDDKKDYLQDQEDSDKDEEERYLQKRIEDNMKMPMGDRFNGATTSLLSPFGGLDTGMRTGVKGVIADARAFEEAKRSGGWMKGKRDSILAWGNVKLDKENKRMSPGGFLGKKEEGDGSGSDSDEFFERWRQQRREELEKESTSIRNRRTSPSMRRFGRFDEVDAMGYLDAIEKVTQETVVIVFVYDPEVCSCYTDIYLSVY